MAYAFTRRQNNEIIDATHINELQAAIEDISANGGITVANTTSIALALVAGELTASAVFGTTAGTIAEGSALALKADAADLEDHVERTDNPHAVTKTQVGLSNVNNTSDLDKPVSVATQLALDGKAASVHGHAIDDITDLQDELDAKSDITHVHDSRYYTETEVNTLLGGKANTAHTHSIADTTGLQTALDGKASTTHNHDAAYSPLGHNHDADYADIAHDHDDDYAPLGHNHDSAYAALGHLHDDRYYTESEVDTALSGKANTTHAHAAGDVTSGTFNIARIPTGTTSSTVALGNHLHTGVYAPASHTHAIGDVTGLQAALDGKAASIHVHAIADVTGLQTELDAKALATHTHHINDLTATGTKNTSTFLRGDNTWATPPNTTYTLITQAEAENAASTTTRLVSGQRLAQAVAFHAPVKTADLTAHTGRTDNPHGVTKGQVGLGNVDNTSDLAKPISTATQTALDGKANTSHTHSASQVTDFAETVRDTMGTALVAGSNVSITPDDVADTITIASSMPAHNHNDLYYTETEMDDILAGIVAGEPAPHDHDERYYTETEIDTALAGKANTSHTHTIAQVTNLQSTLDGKAASSHTHTASQVTDFSSAADARISAQKGSANGLATLGADSKIPTSQIPALALVDVHTVASQSAQLALGAQEGDVAIRTDLGRTYIHNGGSSGSMTDWTEISSPDAVTSVNGQVGVVNLGKGDVGLGNVDNTSDLSKPISTATQTALDGKANISHAHAAADITSGTLALARIPTGTTSSTVALGNHLHTGVYAPVVHTHAIADVTDLQTTLDGKAASSHTHDDRYYTETEVNTALAGKSDTGHVHVAADVTSGTFNIARIPTGTTSTTVALGNHTHSQYAASSHTHAIGDTTGLQAALDAKAASSHTHVATTDLTATGTKNSTTFLRGDNTWAVPPNTVYSTLTQLQVENAADTTAGLVTGQRLSQAVAQHAPVKTADLATKADTGHTHAAADTTSGTFDIARIPTGTTGTTVALGNHTHANYALSSHTHAISDVTGLQAALDAKAASSHTHHVNDMTATGTKSSSTFLRGDNTWATPPNSTYSTLSQVQVENASDTTSGLVTGQRLSQAVAAHAPVKAADLATKANVSHTHAIADTTGLQSALDGKAASSHTHSASDISSGTLSVSQGGTGRATSTTAYGLIAAGTTATGPQQTISPGTSGQFLKSGGASALPAFATLTKSDVGLSNVDNTSDASKPISTATQTALNAKANTTHTHAAGDVTSGTFDIARIPTGTTGTTVALGNHTHAGYALTSHTHAASNITDFEETVRDTMGVALVAGANVTITPDDVNDTITISASGGPHDHDDRYYTETEVNTLLGGKANSSHTHAVTDMTATGTRSSATYLRGDNTWATPTNTTYSTITQAEVENSASTTGRLITGQRVYQAIAKWAALATHTHAIGDVTGLQAALDGKAASVHTHAIADVTGLQSALDAKSDAAHDHGSTYIWGGSWLTGTDTRLPIPIAITGGKAYNQLAAAGSGGDFGTAENVARGDHIHDSRYYTEGEMNFLLDQKAPAVHNHAANEITSGTFSISRIPTGTTSSTVALGNHNHDSSYLKLTGGSLSGPLDVNAEVRDNRLRSLVFVFNNGGLPLQTGMQVDLFMPFNAWVVDSHAIMDTTGTVGVSLWRRPGPNVPTSGYSMGGVTLTGPIDQEAISWTYQDVNYNDILRANIDSVSGSPTRLSWNVTVRLR